IAQLVALLHQASRRLTRPTRPVSDFPWQHRATVEMRPDAVGQVRVTPRALVGVDSEIKWGDLTQVEPSRATNALGDLVVPTVADEEYAFFGAQNTRTMAIEMAEMPEAEA